MGEANHPAHNCSRTTEPAPSRCPHGCYIPAGETVARDLNGRAYCTGCHSGFEERRLAADSPLYREWPALDRRVPKERASADFGVAPAEPPSIEFRLCAPEIEMPAIEGNDPPMWVKDTFVPEEDLHLPSQWVTDGIKSRRRAIADPVMAESRLDGWVTAYDPSSWTPPLDVPVQHKFAPTKAGLVSTPEEIEAWCSDFFTRVIEKGIAKKKVAPPEAPVEKKITIHLEFCETETWQPRKPRWVAIGPQELVLPWEGPTWEAPSFTVIPLGIYPTHRTTVGYRSENGISRDDLNPRFDNFCPRCFTRGPITKNVEGGFKPERDDVMRMVGDDIHGDWFVLVRGEGLDNRWLTNRVFTRQEVRYGRHVPQEHACQERVDA